MIQFNLLPDVKLDYIKAERQRRLVFSISFLVTGVAVALLAILLITNALQKKHIDDLSNDISSESSRLQNEPQISRVLTVQNQLESLTQLHNDKPAASRVFDYLNELTPNSVSISNFSIDFTQETVTITGNADALSSVNQYIDTLKATTYKDTNGDNTNAFSNVVLSSFGLSSGNGGGKPASYTITFDYDKNIFDITQKVTLSIPTETITHSQASQPSDLFQSQPSSGSSSSKGGS